MQKLLQLNLPIPHLRLNVDGGKLNKMSEEEKDAVYLRNADFWGWKHACAPPRLEMNQDAAGRILFVVTAKNPYSWLLSMWRHPYHYVGAFWGVRAFSFAVVPVTVPLLQLFCLSFCSLASLLFVQVQGPRPLTSSSDGRGKSLGGRGLKAVGGSRLAMRDTRGTSRTRWRCGTASSAVSPKSRRLTWQKCDTKTWWRTRGLLLPCSRCVLTGVPARRACPSMRAPPFVVGFSPDAGSLVPCGLVRAALGWRQR